jgi:N-acetylmuramoyl-L-alanine amidase
MTAQASVLAKVPRAGRHLRGICRGSLSVERYGANALWQGAALAADAVLASSGMPPITRHPFACSRALATRFPSSALSAKVALSDQETPGRQANHHGSPSHKTATAASTPTPAPAGLAALPAALTGITREVLPEVLRIVIQLGKEVAFYDERIDGPPRVFLDLQNTRAVETLRDAAIRFPDDVVRQVRIGRQPNQRTRVVLDLKGDARYSVYTLYDPYRIVVDFERKRAIAPTLEPRLAVSPEAKPLPIATSPVAAKPAPAPEVKVIATAAPATETVPPLIETETTPPPPLPPSTNANGGFSMSRQLGLGVARIVIDAGHGGHDPGAKARGLEEAELVLDVALRLEALLKDAGVEVIMTRRTDTFIALEERTAIANRAGADLFLSIHSNASATDLAHGVETYFLNFAPNPQAEAIAAREKRRRLSDDAEPARHRASDRAQQQDRRIARLRVDGAERALYQATEDQSHRPQPRREAGTVHGAGRRDDAEHPCRDLVHHQPAGGNAAEDGQIQAADCRSTFRRSPQVSAGVEGRSPPSRDGNDGSG